MTEAEWLDSLEPEPMLEHLRGKISDRKLRLFACACMREVWDLLEILEQIGEGKGRFAVTVAERFAEGKATNIEVLQALQPTEFITDSGWSPWSNLQHVFSWSVFLVPDGFAAALYTSRQVAKARHHYVRDVQMRQRGEGRWPPSAEALAEAESAWATTLRHQCVLLHDIAGNPFRDPVAIDASWLAANDAAAARLAQGIYDNRCFAELPILADALEDAGCRDAGVLGHCRSGEDHVRGCWLLDALLEKE